MKLFLSLLLVASCASLVSASSSRDDVVPRLIQWLKEGGGMFHDGLEIRKEGGFFGMFATKDIPEDELLLVVQRHQLLTEGPYAADEGFDGTIWCPTVYNLIDELKLQKEGKDADSKYGPYIEYLLQQEEGQLPSHWSEPGQQIFLELLAQDNNIEHNPTGALRKDDLRPSEPVDYIVDDWKLGCQGSDDLFEQHAALLLLQRGWDELMIPVYDMMSHRNGKWLNTKSNSVHNQEEPVMVRAATAIKKGDEIYTSYNLCTDCGNRATSGYGTPEILRDFGFVENYPQRWFLTKAVKFDLNQNDDGSLEVVWKTKKKKKTSVKSIVWMQHQLERLRYFSMDDDDVIPMGVLPKEWNVMKQYRSAVMIALTEALKSLGAPAESEECSGSNEKSCAIAYRYDDLTFRPDLVDYNVDTCDTSISLNFENFTKIDKPSSLYQTIYYNKQHEPNNDNVCFSLHNIWQMCGSYRPHYHEMVVHYTARYLPNIKRVAFVGGGDSMLLHEILKYPSLELVIGLELDQMVTRSAFRHFGTQPHWDNPKVQWWFGDASKTLLMLPQTYFNSFDMVLVDLSETVMSLSVTDGLDIFSALGLLLNEQGIFVKNELYMEQMSNIFKYALQIHYSDVPVICSQCLIFGSNGIDFSSVQLTDHGIDDANLYLQPLDQIPDPYEYWHDFRYNNTAADICRHEFGNTKEQVASPGVVLFLDALKIKVTDAAVVSKDLSVVLEKELSWKIIDTTLTSSVVHLVFQQGTIVLRIYPDYQYCAVDIHIWSSFESQETVQSLVLQTFQAESHQSYRVVAGGIFGLDSWKEDAATIGPKLPSHCHDRPKENTSTKTETKKGKKPKEDPTKLILKETLRTIVSIDKEELITVWCGKKKDNCALVKVLEKELGYQNVVPLYDCDVNEFAESAVADMRQCEAEIQKSLASSSGKIRAVILDSSTTYAFARIAYKVMHRNRKVLFGDKAPNLLAWASYPATDEDDWHRNLMERFRTEIILFEPNFATETLLEFDSFTLEMGMTSSGDFRFTQKFLKGLSNLESSNAMKPSVRDLRGGLYLYYKDWKPDPYYLPQDYDQTLPLKQYQEQHPLGYQSLFQLGPTDADHPDRLDHLTKDTLEQGMRNAWRNAGYKDDEHIEINTYSIGEGFIVSSTVGTSSSATLLYDGRTMLNLNLYTEEEDSKLHQTLITSLALPTIPMEVKLRDVQPRGYGRVVNFAYDLAPQQKVTSSSEKASLPHWAKFGDSAHKSTQRERSECSRDTGCTLFK